MNPTPRPCVIVRSEKSGAVVRFTDGHEGYVPGPECYWKWRRGISVADDPTFQAGEVITVVPSPGQHNTLPHYSYKRAHREPWERTLDALKQRQTAGGVEVQAVVVNARENRVYVVVVDADWKHDSDWFEVDAVITRDRLPLDEFPEHAVDKSVPDRPSEKPLNDLLFEGDRVRAVVDGWAEASAEVFLSVRAVRVPGRIGGGRAAGPGGAPEHPQLRALWNRMESTDEPFAALRDFGSDHTVAVVCDDDVVGPAAVQLLTAVGFTASVANGPPAPGAAAPDAVVLDVDAVLRQGQLAAELARWLATAPSARMVLLHSDLPPKHLAQLKAMNGLYHGAVRKWYKPRELVSAVRTALDGAWEPNPHQTSDGAVWRELAMRDEVDHDRRRADAIDGILHQVQLGIGATAVALVRFDLAKRRTTLEGASGVRLDFQHVEPHLDKSPIRDMVEDHECFRVDDAGRDEGVVRFLNKLLPPAHEYAGTRPTFRSFLGLRLMDFGRGFAQTTAYDRPAAPAAAPADDRELYALMAFHPETRAFSPAAAQLFCRAAVLLLAVLERDAARREMMKHSEYVMLARNASFLLHEFKTRIAAARTWNNLLGDDVDRLRSIKAPDSNQLARLQATSTSLNRVMGELAQVNDLFLTLTAEERRPFRLASVVDVLRLVFQEQLHGLGVQFEAEFNWEGQVESSRGQVSHVLSNLIQNALDQFQQAGCRRPVLRLQVERKGPVGTGGRAQVVVTDNGIGIPWHERERIFQYNFSTKPDGSGIGLHVSRLIAERLDGSLVLETSERFVQTRFVLEIPV